MKSWYQIRAQAQAEGEAEILLYDDIGFFGISAKDFVEDLKARGDLKKITLRINSYGGEVFDGLAIYNVLARHPAEVTVWVDGIAASIASVIAMAGDKIIMPDNAFMMIHRSWGLVVGNAEDMTDWADTMEKMDKAIVLAYQKKSARPAEDILQAMSDETWLTASEAKEWGFADEIAAPVKLAARATFRAFKKLPAALKDAPPETEAASLPAPAPTPVPQSAAINPETIRAEADADADRRIRELLDICTKAGIPDAAADFLNRGMTTDQVRERLADAPAIRDACAAARVPDRAPGYIRGGLSLKEVRSELFDVLHARQGTEIDNKLGPEDVQGDRRSKIDYKEIFANYSRPKK